MTAARPGAKIVGGTTKQYDPTGLGTAVLCALQQNRDLVDSSDIKHLHLFLSL